MILSAAAFGISASADAEYGIKIKLTDTSVTRGEKYAVVPMDITENSGFACMQARIISEDSITIAGFKLKEEFSAEFLTDGNSMLWNTADTMNHSGTGTFADVYADVSKVTFPGRYAVSFTSIGDKTVLCDENTKDVNTEWQGGIITVNGNSDDIAAADLIGDTDDDGAITASDALIVLQDVTDAQKMEIKGTITGNVDSDEIISANDALNILQMTTGSITDFDGKVMVGIYFDEETNEISRTIFYKDKDGTIF